MLSSFPGAAAGVGAAAAALVRRCRRRTACWLAWGIGYRAFTAVLVALLFVSSSSISCRRQQEMHESVGGVWTAACRRAHSCRTTTWQQEGPALCQRMAAHVVAPRAHKRHARQQGLRHARPGIPAPAGGAGGRGGHRGEAVGAAMDGSRTARWSRTGHAGPGLTAGRSQRRRRLFLRHWSWCSCGRSHLHGAGRGSRQAQVAAQSTCSAYDTWAAARVRGAPAGRAQWPSHGCRFPHTSSLPR